MPTRPTRPNNQESSQAPLQSHDWYVIADEGELTLRISDGLRVGEDRWGELTLNHPLSAHRWLEFNIDADGELWCRSSRKDISVRSDGDIQDAVMLDAGVAISLPHNLLHISNHIRRGDRSTWLLEVGLLETAGSTDIAPEDSANFDGPVDTHDSAQLSSEVAAQVDIGPLSEPAEHQTHSTQVPTQVPTQIPTQIPTQGKDAPEQTQGNPPPKATSAAHSAELKGSARPELNNSANDSVETFIPTLEAVVVAPRPVASEEAGPAIERAVAKLKNRSRDFGGRQQPERADSTESALVPVDAAGPFHTDEIRAALQQPIQVGEPGHRPTKQRSVQGNQPIYTPSVTTSIVTTVPESRLRLVAGVAITLLVLLGAALLVAITAASNDQPQRSLANGNNTNKTAAANPQSSTPNTVAKMDSSLSSAQSTATTSTARTNSLLQTASALLSNPSDLQPDTLDFAIRSLNLVLAAQPENQNAQRLLASAQLIRLERNTPETALPAALTGPSSVPAANNPGSAYNNPDQNAGSDAGTYTYTDPRLARAAQLIAQGAILAPRQNSAVSLIMSVLAEDPSLPEAVKLLNRSASVLVAQADEEYATLGVYAARNTLEEVLSFHPNHGPANQRWRAWVDSGSPTSAMPATSTGPDSAFDSRFDSRFDSTPEPTASFLTDD